MATTPEEGMASLRERAVGGQLDLIQISLPDLHQIVNKVDGKLAATRSTLGPLDYDMNRAPSHGGAH